MAMQTLKHIVLSAIALAAFCSTAAAQLNMQQVAKFGYPYEKDFRVTGGREVEFSADGSKMIAAFYGSSAQLYDLNNYQRIGGALGTSGDGEIGFVNDEIAYTADWDCVRLWDTKSGDRMGDGIPHQLREDTIIHPAISPQGKYMATRPTMNSVQIIEVASRKLIGKPKKYSSDVHSIRFSDDGAFLMVRAGNSLYAIDAETGDKIVGPIKAGWLFQHFAKQQKLVTTEQTKDGAYKLVIRTTDQEGWPETHRSSLPGRLKRIVELEGNKILLQSSNVDYTPDLFIVALDKPGTRVEVETNADRAFGVVVPPNKQHWICSNIREIRCQKFGQAKPVWRKSVPPSGYDQYLSGFNNEYFIIRDKDENFGIYHIADGSEAWKQPGVKRFNVTDNKIALCTSEGVEIWVID